MFFLCFTPTHARANSPIEACLDTIKGILVDNNQQLKGDNLYINRANKYGIGFVSLNSDGKIISFNDLFADMAGVSPQFFTQLIGADIGSN